MKYDFLIFDLDGTIIDSLQDITGAVNSVRKEFGLKTFSLEEIRSFLGSGIKALMERAMPEESKESHLALERFKYYYGQCLTDTTLPYSGIENMLETLKDRKKAILSNKTENFSCEILKRLGLADHFLKIWGGDTAGVKKPEPKPILDLIKITRSDPSKTIMIGDSANDFLAAKAAGIPSIAVLYGYSDKSKIDEYKPDFIAENPDDIIKIVS